MKIKIPNDEYIKKAEALTNDERDRLFARMGGKLTRRMEDKRLTSLAAIAIQLEVEDIELAEWRERMKEINHKEKSKVKKTH